jgi:hypothetical protein
MSGSLDFETAGILRKAGIKISGGIKGMRGHTKTFKRKAAFEDGAYPGMQGMICIRVYGFDQETGEIVDQVVWTDSYPTGVIKDPSDLTDCP